MTGRMADTFRRAPHAVQSRPRANYFKYKIIWVARLVAARRPRSRPGVGPIGTGPHAKACLVVRGTQWSLAYYGITGRVAGTPNAGKAAPMG
jgi:hypothetical protein